MTQGINISSHTVSFDPSLNDHPLLSRSQPSWQPHEMSVNEEYLPGPSKCPGPIKPKQTKSRNGCVTCKLKRLKCDEKKPGCDQCAKRNVTCGGYKKDFKWRPFEEQSVSVVVKQSSSPPLLSTPTSTSVSTSASASTSKPASTTEAPAGHVSSLSSKPKPVSKGPPRQSKSGVKKSTHNTSTPLPERSRISTAQRSVRTNPFSSQPPTTIPQHSLPSHLSPPPPFGSDETSDLSRTISPEEDVLLSSQPAAQDVFSLEQSPLNFPDLSASIFWEGLCANAGLQSDGMNNVPAGYSQFDNFMQPTWWPPPLIPPGYMPAADTQMKASHLVTMPGHQGQDAEPKREGFDDDDIEEVMRPYMGFDANQMAYSVAPNMHCFPIFQNQYWPLNQLGPMGGQVKLSMDSDEMIVSRFENKTCAIMSVKDGPWENPWRTLVRPLMHQNRIIYNVVASMACLHQRTKHPELFSKGKEHFAQAFGALKAMGNNNLHIEYDVAFAAMLGLAFAESWASCETTGTNYIKQSRPLMYRAIEECQSAPRGREHIDRVTFLCRTWIYLDVLSRLTSSVDDDSSEFEQVTRMVSDQLADVDPLMGVASTLFPIVGRVANLVKDVCKLPRNTSQLIARASNLKLELQTWQPVPVGEVIQDETTTVDHNVHTALAYKWATLLYLHQAVPEIPMASCSALAEKTMKFLEGVPVSSRTTVVQIYPMLAASCEANTHERRTWARERWDAMRLRMGITNVDGCVDVVREVWNRRDVFAREIAHGSINHLQSPQHTSSSFSNQQDPNVVPGFAEWPEPLPSDRGRSRFDYSRLPEETFAQPGAMSLSENDPLTGELRREFTVRGKLHWVGVMKDNNWQVLLG